MYSSDELFQHSQEGYFCVKHKNNTRASAETVYHESTYIILFLIRHNDSIYVDKGDNLYTSSLCLTLMTSQ